MFGGQAVTGRVERVVRGNEDTRVRATWRYLLAAPLILTTEAVSRGVGGALGLRGMLPYGLLQAGVFAVLLVGWARAVDRRPVRGYGLSASGSWVGRVLVALAAIVAAHVAWYALGSALGWTSVEVALSAPEGSLAPTLAAVFAALAVNVWVQDTVFFGIALRNAAEGLRARGVPARHAVAAGWLAGVGFFVWVHGPSLEQVPALAVAGALFGLLYVHTGELALPIGFHLGVNFSGGWLFAPASLVGERPVVVAVSETLPVLGGLSAPRIPQMLLAYLGLLGWLWWRRGVVPIDPTVSRWARPETA